MTRSQLQDLRDNKGDKETHFHNAVRDNMYKGQRLDDVKERAHNTTRTDFIDCLTENLDQRFPAAELDVVAALGKVFDIRRYPAAQDTQNYAEDAIAVLAVKFGQPAGDAPALVSPDRLKTLFPQFKRSLQLLGNLTLEEACQHTILDFSDDLPDFATLANIALAIPVSSVPCERGFSLQNRVKTYQRSRLSDCSVDNEMLLSMEAPDYSSPQAEGFLLQAARKFSEEKQRSKTHF